MGVRFHKSIWLLPFVRLIFSKGGISFSFGRPGASVNIGSKGARGSVGLPGTGLSYRKTLKSDKGGLLRALLLLGLIVAAGLFVFVLLTKTR